MSAAGPESANAATGHGSVRPALVLAVVTAVAALPRLAGLFDAFWLDEIWSLELAARAGSPLAVLTVLHHDNNHYLNTLWLLAVGPHAPPVLYRLPAFAAGVAATWLAGRTEWRAGETEGTLAALLVGLSYPFVHYGSEARGYGLVILVSLAAYAALLSHHRDGRPRSALLFAAVASLGFLSHLTFLTVYGPLLGWSVIRLAAARRAPGRAAALFAVCHLLPIAAFAFLVLVDLRHMGRGGGPDLPLVRGWLDGWAYALGAPLAGLPAVALVAAFGIALLVGLATMARRRDDAWVFFLLALAAPAALLFAVGARYAPPRYFLASLAFGLLLLARGLAALLRAGRPLRLAAAILVAAFLAGNGWRVGRFLAEGRGAYREAVGYLAAHETGDTIRVGSDHDFRAETVLRWYARFLPDGKTLAYVQRAAAAEAPPAWRLVHELGDDFRPRPAFDVPAFSPPALVRYELEAVFPKYGLSGWQWALYRRVERQPTPSPAERRRPPPPAAAPGDTGAGAPG